MKEFLAILLARAKKHLGSETANIFTIRTLYISALRELMDLMGYEEAIKRIFTWGFSMGHEYMLTLTKDIEKIKPFEETEIIAKVAWYTFAGRIPAGTDSGWEVWDGYRIFIAKFWDDDCPWCRGVRLPIKKPICAYPAGAYEGAYQTSQVILYTAKKLDTERFAVVREIKCKAIGDDRCEFWIVDFPRVGEEEQKELLKKAREKYPDLFKSIEPEFSFEVRRKIL